LFLCFYFFCLSVFFCVTNRQYNGQETQRQKDKQRSTQ
jgi:hypothetical protein